MSEDKKIKKYSMYSEDDRQRYDKDFHNYTCVSTKYVSTDKEGIVKILAHFKYSPSCYLLYRKMTLAEAAEMIDKGQGISFVGRYLSDFNINTLKVRKGIKLNDFDAAFCYLDGSTSFANAVFAGEYINFYRANFGRGNVSFYRADFGAGSVNFSNANFDKGNVNFAYSRFAGEKMSFSGANFGEGHVNFSKSDFGQSSLTFHYTGFSDGDIIFKSARAGIVSFEAIKFVSDVNLQFAELGSLHLKSVINKDHMRISGIQDKLSFAASENLGRLDINWQENLARRAIERAHLSGKMESAEQRRAAYAMAAHDFLLLKENYSSTGQYEYEDSAHRAHMKYNTRSLKWRGSFGKKLFNAAFGAISGYGTKISNILLSCFLAVIAFGFVYLSAFVHSADTTRAFLKAMYFSTITFLTIGYGDLSPMNTGFSDLQTFCTGLEGFMGLLLMSMVTVVVVRKVLR